VQRLPCKKCKTLFFIFYFFFCHYLFPCFSNTMGLITANGLAQHTRVLASPEFEGRLPASEGEERTLRYLTTAFAQIGCSPAGNKQGTEAWPT
jgi:hypothetical protein